MSGFEVTVYRLDGTIEKYQAPNQVLLGGLNLWLDSMFRAQNFAFLYKGLISATSLTSLSSSDTMSSHPGWYEVPSYYSWSYTNSAGDLALQPYRAEYGYNGGGELRSGTNTLGDFVDFTRREYISAPYACRIGGLFLSTSRTITSTQGTLFATARFLGNEAVNLNVGDILEARYITDVEAV